MHVTLVKKIKADGSPCRKCADVEQRLIDSGLMGQIDEIVIADERDPQSLGMELAGKHRVDTAPFFVVRDEDGTEHIYTVYFKFVKEVLNSSVAEQEEVKELLDQNPDLHYL
ncbi:MAG: hypothetical protein ACT4NU_09900 [Chromatiales bacterium]